MSIRITFSNHSRSLTWTWGWVPPILTNLKQTNHSNLFIKRAKQEVGLIKQHIIKGFIDLKKVEETAMTGQILVPREMQIHRWHPSFIINIYVARTFQMFMTTCRISQKWCIFRGSDTVAATFLESLSKHRLTYCNFHLMWSCGRLINLWNYLKDVNRTQVTRPNSIWTTE